ncbi:MAG: ribonuclease HI [Anaerolineae bacterium]|nr:ribonuclease HI [Anaerolineae bacterium]
MNPIIIHTDGSCETQTRLGGWAAILQCGDKRRELSGSAIDTTVNIMELTAVIEALSALKQIGTDVQIITDSNYVVKGINEWLPDWIARGWKTAGKKPVANRELWEQLQGLIAQHTVTFTWVPREQNTEADKLAQAARIAQNTPAIPPTTAQPVATPTTIHLMIAGSRYATWQMIDYARKVVRRAHAKGYTIIVGDNPKGIDMAVVQECRRLKAKVLVAGVTNRPRNGGCSHGSYIRIERDSYRAMGGNLLDKYTVRDRWMADNATMGIFVWNGDSRGTKQGHDYMVSRGKEAHLITFKKGARRG